MDDTDPLSSIREAIWYYAHESDTMSSEYIYACISHDYVVFIYLYNYADVKITQWDCLLYFRNSHCVGVFVINRPDIWVSMHGLGLNTYATSGDWENVIGIIMIITSPFYIASPPYKRQPTFHWHQCHKQREESSDDQLVHGEDRCLSSDGVPRAVSGCLTRLQGDSDAMTIRRSHLLQLG